MKTIVKEKYGQIDCDGRKHHIVSWSWNAQVPASKEIVDCDCKAK